MEHHFLSLTVPTGVRHQVRPAFMCRERWGTGLCLTPGEWYTDHWTESFTLDICAHTKQLGVKWANVTREIPVYVCASHLQTARRPKEWKYLCTYSISDNHTVFWKCPACPQISAWVENLWANTLTNDLFQLCWEIFAVPACQKH